MGRKRGIKKNKERACQWEAEWQEEKERKFGGEEMELKRAPEGWRWRGWGKKEMERERVAVVMWCEKLRISQLMSHFAKLSACFGVFFFFLLNSPKKIQRRLREIKKGSWIKCPEQKKKPSTSAVNDMHLIPMRPNKAVTERFHALISSGLCEGKKKGMIAASIWVFQCVVFVAVQFLFFFCFCLPKTLVALRDGSSPIGHLLARTRLQTLWKEMWVTTIFSILANLQILVVTSEITQTCWTSMFCSEFRIRRWAKLPQRGKLGFIIHQPDWRVVVFAKMTGSMF